MFCWKLIRNHELKEKNRICFVGRHILDTLYKESEEQAFALYLIILLLYYRILYVQLQNFLCCKMQVYFIYLTLPIPTPMADSSLFLFSNTLSPFILISKQKYQTDDEFQFPQLISEIIGAALAVSHETLNGRRIIRI